MRQIPTLLSRTARLLAGSAAVSALMLGGCSTGAAGMTGPGALTASSPTVQSGAVAPGAPGNPTTWATAAKTGAGTSYEAYVDGRFADGGPTGTVSRVWFSLADGVLTETMYGLIHEAQIKQLRFAVQTETGLSVEGTDTTSRTEYLHTDSAGRPLSPAYRILVSDKQGRYEIEKRIFTDPDRDSLVMQATIRALKGQVTPHVILEPHMANTGGGDRAGASQEGLHAHEGNAHLFLRPSAPFTLASAGFLGSSDGLGDLMANGRLTRTWASTGDTPGSVVLTGALETVSAGQSLSRDFVIGFGRSHAAAQASADGAFATGLDEVLARFNGEDERVGWEDYMASLDQLPRLAGLATDGGRLAYASALMLKVQEDRTHAGALIASLSNPWGETVDATRASTGYKAVWPRDFYQVAMAMLALGDTETPLAAFRYLPKVQVRADTPGNTGATGWFLQKTQVDGQIEWLSVQLDQTAMPIMLGWKLWKAGVVSDAEIALAYADMLRPAADFLVDGGRIGLQWNDATITPPFTQQERWEEQDGFSPSTTAAVIAGLVTAADIARASGDAASASRYLAAADDYEARIEARMFTTRGPLGDGRYFMRLSKTEDPNSGALMGDNNGQPGQPQDRIIDGGFLELVRYGVRPANDPYILATLPEYDDQSLEPLFRVRYDFGPEGDRTPGWRRYGVDGYGEDHITGANYGVGGVMAPGQRGRVWPFFTGERGHYELAAGTDIETLRQTYVRGMERFANEGLMLSEQVWDGVGNPTPRNYRLGQPTDSATPLAWTHAEYLKLLRSLADSRAWDFYPIVAERYGPATQTPSTNAQPGR